MSVEPGPLPPMLATPRYARVVLKISGEGLCRPGGFGVDGPELDSIAREILSVHEAGVDVAVVIGGGNFLRGATVVEGSHIQPATGHYMGMLGTVINALALQDTLEHLGLPTRVMSAVEVTRVCESFIRRRAIRHLEKRRVVIFAAGTGNPFVTTDTAAALRATELHAQAVLKATKVDGVYDKDPKKHADAVRFTHLSFEETISRRLGVMDVSAFDLCHQSRIPIIVFDLKTRGNMRRVVMGEDVGTTISG